MLAILVALCSLLLFRVGAAPVPQLFCRLEVVLEDVEVEVDVVEVLLLNLLLGKAVRASSLTGFGAEFVLEDVDVELVTGPVLLFCGRCPVLLCLALPALSSAGVA